MPGSGYRVLLMPAAQRDIDVLEGKLLSRIERAVLRLAEAPRPMELRNWWAVRTPIACAWTTIGSCMRLTARNKW